MCELAVSKTVTYFPQLIHISPLKSYPKVPLKTISLQAGDTIGVIAPASTPRNMEIYREGLALLESRGYKIALFRDDIHAHGYLADTDAVRIAEFNAMLNRSDIKVLMCARGGYGTMRLLPYLDYEAARRNPKVLIGYSDITALHLAFYEKANWIGLSGHLVVEWPTLDEVSEKMFWDLLTGNTPETVVAPDDSELVPFKEGTAEGTLLGGNFALVSYLVGTPYFPNMEGAILFLEDIGENIYALDRMFAKLKLAGILDKLGGLVLGKFTEIPEAANALSLEQVFEEYLRDMPYPIATNLCYGHVTTKNCIPVGLQARLEVTEGKATLQYLESITA